MDDRHLFKLQAIGLRVINKFKANMNFRRRRERTGDFAGAPAGRAEVFQKGREVNVQLPIFLLRSASEFGVNRLPHEQ